MIWNLRILNRVLFGGKMKKFKVLLLALALVSLLVAPGLVKAENADDGYHHQHR